MLDGLKQKPLWAGLKTIAMIEESREVKGKVSIERRFFISSLPADAARIAKAVRAHWAIENNLHWTLDVVFEEDKSRIRTDHAPEKGWGHYHSWPCTRVADQKPATLHPSSLISRVLRAAFESAGSKTVPVSREYSARNSQTKNHGDEGGTMFHEHVHGDVNY